MTLGWSRRAKRWVVAGIALLLAAPVAAPLAGTAVAAPNPTPIAPDAPWLTIVNYYRQMAGLPLVVEDPVLSYGSGLHSCYMLQNGISHDEVPGLPGYTAEGDAAGNAGNVAVTSVAGTSARTHIELWMTGPFHAVGILRPNLQRVGFGKCDDPAGARWKSGATLDVIRGLGPSVQLSAPILFPGNGTTTNLDRFYVETPSPLTYCGWPSGGGLPVMALMPESVAGTVTSQIVGPNGPLETCTLSQNNTDGVAQALLKGNNAVVSMARNRLEAGTYTVTVTTSRRSVTWSFTVDPTVANGTATTVQPAPTPAATPTPAPSAAPTGQAAGFLPLTPVRVVDTRDGLGATTIIGQVPTRLQIGGQQGIPTSPQAISANFTVTDTRGAGYLTVWNCASDRPVVASLNFGAAETVANAASVPVDASGGICVYSPVTTELVVDVNGYYSTAAIEKFASITPSRLMDTRVPVGPSTRLAQGQTVQLQVTGQGGIPAGASAVALNVASVYPDFPGYVTVWPCDQQQPFTASLNPMPGLVKPNMVISPLSASGTVCLFSSTPVDLVVDATGYLSSSSSAKFTSSQPFRFTDTREATQPALNSGTGGDLLGRGQILTLQVAGQRGIPSSAKAVSVNIAVTDALSAGFITAWPCGVPQPTTANVNYEASAAVSNGAQVPLSADGKLCLYTSASAHLIVDVNGWWA